jgi:starch-binding outer membrane protein, SusD/RagB family
MRKSIFIFSALLLLMILIQISCSNDFLNTKPQDRISSDATWADGPLSEAFVFNIYASLGLAGFEEQAMAGISDEAMFTHAGRNINTFTEGLEGPGALAWKSPTYEWGSMYSAIRKANIAIENLPISTFADDNLRDRLLGEAYFLRAYYYHQLMRNYGGVPLISNAYGLGEDYSIARSTFSETIDFIVNDLDQATTLLDGKAETPGRTSKLASMALKARVLLYAASDLHESSKVSSIGADGALWAYQGGAQATRWSAAQAAAKAVLDAGQGYKLDLSAPVSAAEGTQNYISIAMGGESALGDPSAAVELIFQRTHTADYTEENNWPLGGINYGINNGPNGYHNWAGNTPIQQLVDDYEMMDGSKFDWNNASHAADPYTNRDPRFYGTILYDGANWKPRPSDVAGLEPYNQIQTGYYDNGRGGLINGIDTRESAIENWNGSRTHYYTRKFIDPDPGKPDDFSAAQTVPWPFIRYTEMVLSYAEASQELGQDAIAREWINKLRFRAGLPATTASGNELKNLIRNERKVELVYEEHRFFDARRWLLGEELGSGIKAINIIATLKPGATPHVPYRHDKSVYDYTYDVFDNTENETRVWRDKMYYRPLSRDEINRNSLLVQNPNY